jgi:hypothetical protein
MSNMVLFIDPETGEESYIIQPFATVEELKIAEAMVLAAEPPAETALDLRSAFITSLFTGSFDKAMDETLDAMSDPEYVITLYSQVLRRDFDAEGANFWIQQLAGGAAREDILEAFVTCDEAVAISSPEQIALLGQHFPHLGAAGDMG